MELRKDEQENEQLRKREEKQRPRFRPAVEMLEERISLSGLGHSNDWCNACFHHPKGW